MTRFRKSMVKFMAPVLKIVLSFFFEPKFLAGRYFDDKSIGYVWAFRTIWQRSILRLAPPLPFPAALTCRISRGENIEFHQDDLNNFQSPGTYFQNLYGKIRIGRGSYIAANVGIITANHKLGEPDEHEDAEDVYLGEQCWIGMNSVILPGVVLGDRTVVAAGAVVTKSFEEGACVIGGVPAQIIKRFQ